MNHAITQTKIRDDFQGPGLRAFWQNVGHALTTQWRRTETWVRDWFLPTYEPTAEERRMLKRAREDYKKGNYYTFDEVRKELGV